MYYQVIPFCFRKFETCVCFSIVFIRSVTAIISNYIYVIYFWLTSFISSEKYNGQSKISMCKMPPISLTKAYNYCLWIVCLSTRYTISYPFRHFLCFKMTFCDVFEGYYFWKKSILLFEKSYFFWEKMFFSLLVTPVLPVSSP